MDRAQHVVAQFERYRPLAVWCIAQGALYPQRSAIVSERRASRLEANLYDQLDRVRFCFGKQQLLM